MSTGDPSPGIPAGVSDTDLAQAMAKEIEKLANQFFAGVPGPVHNVVVPPVGPATAIDAPGPLVPPHFGPNALNMGAGGASPALSLPPIPGPLHRPPLAASPLPKESDLRAIPTLLSENFGTPSTIALASARPDGATPYFLGLAGLPSPLPGSLSLPGTPLPSTPLPSTPAIPGFPSSPGASLPGSPPLPGAPSVPGLPNATTLATPTTTAPLSAMSPQDVPTSLPGGVPENAPYGSAGIPSSGIPAISGGVPSGPSSLAGIPAVPAGDVSYATRDALPTSSSYDFRPEVVPDLERTRGIFDPNAVKRDFPILRERIHGRPLVWFDNAATTQKPQSVIDRLTYYYEHENSNIHRGAHTLAARATDAYEAARDKVRRFLNAPSAKQIIFVRGATEAINLVAKSWGRRNIGAGDEIVITWLEHHANIVPWQQLASEKGARLRVVPVNDRGEVILEEYEKLLGPRTRLVSFTHVSNALGTILPAREMVEMAHRHGARVLVDGAQSVPHMPVDVQQLDCDFCVFSGHKLFGPTGIGVLYGKADVLEAMPPWQGGGNMIADVTFEKTTYQPPPGRFEAGTGNIADAVGLGAAIDYVSALGLENVSRYEHELLLYAEERLACVPGFRMIGTAAEKAGVISFVLDGIRTEDVGGALDQEGIAVRSGHHCAQPILRRFGLESTVRASLAPYNTRDDVDALVAALLRIQAGRSSPNY
jgi:cysteine desulfurase/selenocysteine lyase